MKNNFVEVNKDEVIKIRGGAATDGLFKKLDLGNLVIKSWSIMNGHIFSNNRKN